MPYVDDIVEAVYEGLDKADLTELDPACTAQVVGDIVADIIREVDETPDTKNISLELEAMQKVVTALEGLDSRGASRVLTWAQSQFGDGGYY